MKESTTYQGIIEEGRIEQARGDVLRVGKKRLGKPSAATQDALESINSIERLERMLDRAITASSWEELLGNGK